MPRCKHDRLDIIELGTSGTAHIFERGALRGHESFYGDCTGRIEVQCFICGWHRVYSCAERLPR